MAAKSLLTPELERRLRDHCLAGTPLGVIARDLGFASQTVWGWKKRLGHAHSERTYSTKPQETWWTRNPDKAALLDQLFAEGLTTVEIGRRLGKTKNAVIGRLNRAGMRRRGCTHKTEKQRIDALVKTFPDAGCLYAEGDGGLHGWLFCSAPPRVHFDKLGEPIRSVYCETHHALTHVKPLKAEGAEVIALRRSSTARTRWTAA